MIPYSGVWGLKNFRSKIFISQCNLDTAFGTSELQILMPNSRFITTDLDAASESLPHHHEFSVSKSRLLHWKFRCWCLNCSIVIYKFYIMASKFHGAKDNHFHNSLRLFYGWENFPFNKSEMNCDCQYETGICQLPHELQNDLKLLSKWS